MASRWRDWDLEFKDTVIPGGQSAMSHKTYEEPTKLDQTNVPPSSIPVGLLDLIGKESESRRRQDCIVVSSSRHGDSYIYSRDGELQNQEYTELARAHIDIPTSDSTDKVLHAEARGVGRAQLLKERANKATALGHTNQNEQQNKTVGRGRGKSRTDS